MRDNSSTNLNNKIKILFISIGAIGSIALMGNTVLKEHKGATINNTELSNSIINNVEEREIIIDDNKDIINESPSVSYIEQTPTDVLQFENVEKENNIEEEPIMDIVEEKKVIEEPIITSVQGLELEYKKVVEATTTVNIRSLANANCTKLGTITAGKTLDVVYKENDDWYRVRYNDQDAFISSHYVIEKTQVNINNPIEKMVYFKNDAKMYSDIYNENSILDIPYLEAASVYKDMGDYYLTCINNDIGYIRKADTGVLDGTFAIVDISDQMAYLYEDGQLIISTPVVTGKPSTPTRKGLHKVWYTSGPRTLKGTGYEVPVKSFEAFDGGIGFHDADAWRSDYGRNIYLTRGSHGCVNMPNTAAKVFHDNLQIGDKVLVKQ